MEQAAPTVRPRRARRWRRVFLWSVSLLALWFVAHLAVMLWYGFSDDTRPCDVGVVLGNFVAYDGTPGIVVKARLDRAVELYKAGAFGHVIVSGATAPGGYNESAGMKKYLIEQGVPEDAIVTDPGGANTFFTAQDTRFIMKEHGWHTVMVVSHYYHILRCRLAFARIGIENVRSAHAWLDSSAEPLKVFREFAGFYAYLIRAYPG